MKRKIISVQANGFDIIVVTDDGLVWTGKWNTFTNCYECYKDTSLIKLIDTDSDKS